MSNIVNVNTHQTLSAPLTSKGTISKTNSKALVVLDNASRTALVSAAINGKGAVRKVALANLSGVQSVESFTSRDAIDGSEWGDFLVALTARYGVNQFNRATMRGKSGCDQFMALVVKALELKVELSDTVKAQDAAIKRLGQAQDDAAHVTRLFTARTE